MTQPDLQLLGLQLLAAIDKQIVWEDLSNCGLTPADRDLLDRNDFLVENKLREATVESLMALGLSEDAAKLVKSVFPTA